MNPHTEKALHNVAYLRDIEHSFPTAYYDWKITTLFYIALHLIHGLAHQTKKQIGQTHDEVLRNIRPTIPGRTSPTMPFTQIHYEMYYRLYELSRIARYKAGNRPVLEAINKANYEEALEIYPKLIYYIVKQRGLTDVDHLVTPRVA